MASVFSKDVYSSADAVAVTKSDTNDLDGNTLGSTSRACRALYIGGAGNIKVTMSKDFAENGDDSVTVTFNGIVAGTVLPIQVVNVQSTTTTATDIVALF